MMRHYRQMLIRMALMVVFAALHTAHSHAVEDVGLPIHPKALSSSIVRNTGKGEGTDWIIVNFKADAPYRDVVKYYKGKVGKDAQVQINKTESDQHLSTLILLVRNPKDQINVNISAIVGKKLTEVEIRRNYIKP